MDTHQLFLAVGSVAGMLLVALMAIVPTAMEADTEPQVPVRPGPAVHLP